MPDPTDTVDPSGTEGVNRPPAASETPREESLERSFDRIIDLGLPRLQRPWLDVLTTGVVAGFEVAFGILALLYVDVQTHDPLLGGVAFSIGFIGLLLGHSELFTEGFLVPVTVVAAGEARLRDLGKLWSGTLVGNLAGGWVVAWLIMKAFPTLHAEAVSTASYYVRSGITGRSFCLAVLAGAAITLLTRMHQGTESDGAKIVASVGIAFVLAGIRLFHSVLDSILAFMALDTGRAPFGYADWLGFFAMVVIGNVVGGLGLTTVLRLVRSRGPYRRPPHGPQSLARSGPAPVAETSRSAPAESPAWTSSLVGSEVSDHESTQVVHTLGKLWRQPRRREDGMTDRSTA